MSNCFFSSPSGRYQNFRIGDVSCSHYHSAADPPMHFNSYTHCPVHDGYVARPSAMCQSYQQLQPLPPPPMKVIHTTTPVVAAPPQPAPTQWGYSYNPCVCGKMGNAAMTTPWMGGGNYVTLPAASVPTVKRVVTYKQPVFIPELKHLSVAPVQSATPSFSVRQTVQPAQTLQPAQTVQPAQEKVETKPLSRIEVPIPQESAGADWKVFHCGDQHGTQTLVTMGDTIVEIRPETSVEVTKTTPAEWFEKLPHARAVGLGEDYSHCYVAYTDKSPRTHILVGNYALHVDPRVSLRFTRSTPGYVSQRC